jgi:hypothetical protein
MVYRSFPSELVSGMLCVHPDSGCTCREWTLADVNIAEEAALVEARQADAEEYCAMVACWNARVVSAPADSSFDFFAYCAFLLEEYDELAIRTAESSP